MKDEKIEDNTKDIELHPVKKKEKNHKLAMYLSISFGIVILVVVLLLFFMLKSCNNNDYETRLQIIIDPLIVSGGGENHLNSAQIITFGEDGEESKEQSTYVQAKLTCGQVMEYRYAINNTGKIPVAVKLELNIEEQENIWVTYTIGGANQEIGGNVLFDKVLSSQEKMDVRIYIRVANEDYDAFAKGVFVLNLEERGTS